MLREQALDRDPVIKVVTPGERSTGLRLDCETVGAVLLGYSWTGGGVA